ncbi:hypothetical protein [Brachybacterium sp. UMB0905]|uniref:hypothetical protein n=1 Tax=Brachybacterium sp. UMB0905 TaxID=2069310 RepID=UPI000C80E7BB|nr:hypothetical protein [Brachybacterium sp. UMB0905]PMC76390.1 hypothetical protein CJ197_04335 [Brachybacterium sp. UMB0905]
MNDPTPIGAALDTIPTTPTELVTAADGTTGVIQWEGTAVDGQWLTNYVNQLIAARLVEPWQLGGDKAQTAHARAANRDRLTSWHRALAGLPQEGLDAARQHFEKHGVPADSRGSRRWHLRPSDVSDWVRARARRLIPAEKACEAHPSEWRHSCTQCDYAGPVDPDRARSYIAQIRATLAQRKDTP